MEVILKKQNGCLVPCNEHDAGLLEKFGVGEWVRCETKKQRNGSFHNKYFALLHYVFENQDKYDTFEAMRAEIVMRAGWYEEHHHVTGRISYQPKSISWSKMDDIEFRDLYSKSIDVILNHFMLGASEEQLMAVVGYA